MSSKRSYSWGFKDRYSVGISGELIERDEGGSPPQIGNVPRFVAVEMIRLADLEQTYRDLFPRDTEAALKTSIARTERERIRTELIDWLIGDLSRGGWIINGRRIVDEIDRICPID